MSENLHISDAFESATELRDAHADLLEQLDRLLSADESVSSETAAIVALEPAIKKFLARGAATGVLIEEIKERTACQILLDYWVSSLVSAGQEVAGIRLQRFDGSKLPKLPDEPCPYRGLDAFRSEHYFFGRNTDSKALLEQVRGNALVVVIGESGSGKSSLVMGGVLPALRDFRVVPPFVPGDGLLEHLVQSVLEIADIADRDIAAHTQRLRSDPDYLGHLLADAAPAIITIDQFEEVFTLSTPQDREVAVENLIRFLHRNPANRAILTVREEFRSRIVSLRALEPFLDGAWYSMRPMGYSQLRDAVEKPAALVNLQFLADIVDDLVKRVLGQPAALPLLQFTLRELWKQRDRNRITWEVYGRVGDPLEALKASADAFYHGLTQQSRDEVKRVLLALVRVDELLEAYRQPVKKGLLLEAGRANTEEVLELLAKGDFVRITAGARNSTATVEVKHEALIRNWPLFVGWIEEKRIERRQRIALTQAAERWQQGGRPDEGLLTGWQLAEAKTYQGLSELEQAFLEASSAAIERVQRDKEDALRKKVEQEQRAKRRILRYSAVVVGILIVASAGIILSAFYQVQQMTAELNRKTQLLASKQSELDGKNAQLIAKQAELNEKNAVLAAQEEAIAIKKDSLREADDALFVKQAKLRLPVDTTIFMHISDERQRARANDIMRRFNAEKKIVQGVDKERPVPVSQVRFFHPDDDVGAAMIVELLNEYLGIEEEIKDVRVRGYEDKVPSGHFEIWFGSSALIGAADVSALDVSALIGALSVESTDRRRSARVKLAAEGARAIPALLAALEEHGEVYRVRLGVAAALAAMGQPVVLPPDKIRLITDLLGDPDSTVRKHAASALVALTDRDTRETVVRELIQNLDQLDDGNKVFNSVVVLGDLRRNAPRDLSATIQEALAATRDRLRRDPSRWRKTLAEIDKYL